MASAAAAAAAAAAVPLRRDAKTELNYYRDPGDGSAPVPVVVGSNKVTNGRPTIPLAVTVKDITGDENKYTLDTHGFQLVQHRSKETRFVDEGVIKGSYCAEMERLYKDITGASRVVVFGHRVRRGPSHWHSLGEGNAANRGPLHRVHVDQSYDGAALIARKHLPAEEAEAVEGLVPYRNRGKDAQAADGHGPSRDGEALRRFQIVNIWRPIRTVVKDPLAVADARSVPDADLVGASVVYGDGTRNETWAVRPNEAHKWYFKRGQTPDEVLFIKCFDSAGRNEAGAPAKRSPHCAFRDPEVDDEEESRESVELKPFSAVLNALGSHGHSAAAARHGCK